ncbi:unnamed protein product, partial [Mesorhabditis spiculigera]
MASEKKDAGKDELVEQVKKFAFFGVAVSTVATLTAIVAVPMLCMYMQNVQSALQDEINFCRTRSGSLREEFTRLEHMRKNEKERSKRQAYRCCSCGIGPAGPPGQQGNEGTPGNDGRGGVPGNPGPDAVDGDAVPPSEDDFCFETAPGY